jgi:hypothetical protein
MKRDYLKIIRRYFMEIDRNIQLTSAEVGSLWSTYMNDTASICVLKHFLETVKDEDVKPEIEYALEISKRHVSEITNILIQEKIPLPIGFKEETDLNPNAPRLFSDSYYLYFLRNIGKNGLAAYGMAFGLATREDMLDLFSEALVEAKEINKRVSKVMLQKGLFIKPPYIDIKHEANYVEKESYLRGWFGQRRTLSVNEVAHLYVNSYNNSLGKALLMGLSQVAKTPEVRDFFVKGHDMARKHIDVLNSILHESSQPSPMTWDTDVMDSITPPFSEKLMMFLTCAIAAMGVANYGGSLSQTFRHDIALRYARMLSEAGSYAEDGASIMIKNGWFERPPQTIDREYLTKGQS